MFKNILRPNSSGFVADNENAPDAESRGEESHLRSSNVRALATGAALAVSLDTSPAVLVSIYDYAHRYRDRARRSA